MIRRVRSAICYAKRFIMAKDKEKEDIVSETKVLSSEILDKNVEVSENSQNKTNDIEDAKMISENVSTSDDATLNDSGSEAPPEPPNQAATEQEEIHDEDDQKTKDIQKSEPDKHKTQSRAGAEPIAPVLMQEKQKSSIFLTFIGGIISGAIGFGAAYYLFKSNTLTNEIAINDIQVELGTNINRNAVDISLNAETNGVQDAQLQSIITKLETYNVQFESLNESLASMANLYKNFDTLNVRVEHIEMLTADMSQLVAELEKRPVATTLSGEVIDAYNSEVAKLLETMAAQREEVETLLDEANTEKAKASEVARYTQANLTLNAILKAFNAGKSFTTDLHEFSKLTGVQIPADLQKIAVEGVPRVETLTDNFPEAARAAIAAERSGDSYDGTTQSFLEFLKSQVQARSVTPKEGKDADAVLSRAEAALRDGQLSKAVEELQALQSPAKEAMADWQAKAQQRLNLVEALNILSAVMEN